MANSKLNDYKYDKIILRIQRQSYYTLAVCRPEFCKKQIKESQQKLGTYYLKQFSTKDNGHCDVYYSALFVSSLVKLQGKTWV